VNPELGAELTRLAARAGYSGPGAVSRLHIVLTACHGVNVTAQAVRYWLGGERVPELGSLVGLLDCLSVVGDERRKVVQLAHPATSRIDSPVSLNRIEEDDIPTVVDPTTPPGPV
jgi:hypothetical protein